MKKKKVAQNKVYYNEHDRSQVYEVLKKKKRSRLKRRWKIFLWMIVLAIFIIFLQSDYSRIRSITIEGNELISESLVREYLGVDENDFMFMTFFSSLEKRLTDNTFFNDVDVSFNPFTGLKVSVEEAKVIAYLEYNQQYILIGNNGKTLLVDKEKYSLFVQNFICLKNFTKDELFEEFAIELAGVDEDVLYQISDIIFSPEDSDPKRVEFIMDDGKILYLRIDDMRNELKSYNQVISTYPNGCYYDFLDRKVYVTNCQ